MWLYEFESNYFMKQAKHVKMKVNVWNTLNYGDISLALYDMRHVCFFIGPLEHMHYYVTIYQRFRHCWPFMRKLQRSSVDYSHNELVFRGFDISLFGWICCLTIIPFWGDFRPHYAHFLQFLCKNNYPRCITLFNVLLHGVAFCLRVMPSNPSDPFF